MIGKPVNHRNQETGCPEQWTLHLTGCYQRVESQMTWEQATSHCKVGDADLLNLHNEVDYRQIINLFGNTEQRFWIALEKVRMPSSIKVHVIGGGNYCHGGIGT